MTEHDRFEGPTEGTTADATLANRVAILTFVTAFALIVGLVAAPQALDRDAALLTRVAAMAPLLFAGAAAGWTRRARSRLRDAAGGGRTAAAKPGRAGTEPRPGRERALVGDTHETRTQRA